MAERNEHPPGNHERRPEAARAAGSPEPVVVAGGATLEEAKANLKEKLDADKEKARERQAGGSGAYEKKGDRKEGRGEREKGHGKERRGHGHEKKPNPAWEKTKKVGTTIGRGIGGYAALFAGAEAAGAAVAATGALAGVMGASWGVPLTQGALSFMFGLAQFPLHWPLTALALPIGAISLGLYIISKFTASQGVKDGGGGTKSSGGSKPAAPKH